MHKLFLIIASFCLTLGLRSQSLTCDTCQTEKAKQAVDSTAELIRQRSEAFKQKGADQFNSKVGTQTDSAARRNLINQAGSRADSASAVLKQRKESYRKQGADQFNSKILSKTDSAARRKQLNRIDARAEVYKGKPKAYWGRLKSQLPPKDKLFKFGLTIRNESYATTDQNPVMRNEKMYSRLYVSPSFTLLGLPFTSNWFFTTESNNSYKNNYFAIRFDVNALRQTASEQIQKEMDEAKKLDRLRQMDLNKNKLETGQLENELTQLKGQVPDYSNWQKGLTDAAQEKAKAELERQQNIYEQKIKQAGEKEKARLEAEYNNKKDSLLNVYKTSLNDSIGHAKANAGEQVDTSKLKRILELQAKLEKLKNKKQEIEKLRQLDSSGLQDRIGSASNPNELKKLMKSKLPGQGLLQNVLSVERLGIGLTSANYSDFTLSAASLKGLDIGVAKERCFWDLSLGKTTRQFIGPFSASEVQFNRHLGIARIGLGKRSGDHLSATYLYAFDREATDSTSPLIRNGVLNLSAKFKLLKQTLIEADWAQSRYRELYPQVRYVTFNQANPVLGNNQNMAWQLKATQQAGENIRFEAQLRQTGAAFRTVGNPFLRRNFRELELKYEQMFMKKKIKLSAGYKQMRDNLVEINTATNRLQGYMLKLSTAFEKLPNLTLSYSPYQQGNNHPDSLYRTNNQFSVTTAVITYRKRFKQINWTGMGNFTRSAMEISGRGPVEYRMMSTIHNFQIGQRHSLMLLGLSNRTYPGVDSLNSNSVQAVYTFLLSKKGTIGAIAEDTRYMNGWYKVGGGLTISQVLIKNLSLAVVVRYDRVDGLWRLNNKDVFTGRATVMWRW